MIWNEQFDDALINLLNEGKSYKQAAMEMSCEFGQKFTKNSCIGRARRLKMPPRPPKVTPMNNDLIMTFVPPRIPEPKKGKPVTIYQLRDGLCKWPYGNIAPYLYCGKPTVDLGCSWCETHCQKVFNKSTFRNVARV